MKKILVCVVLLVFAVSFLPALGAADSSAQGSSGTNAVFPILNHFSAREFTTEPVTAEELNTIVTAGLRAPSAGNRQPWLFTVVQDVDLMQQILPQATEGNILIVVSGAGDGRTNGPVILDCALAAQSMFFASQALGLGARQYTNPGLIERTNNLKTELGMPEDNNAVIVTRFGRLPAGVDVVSSASPRADPEEKVIYR